MSFDYFFPKSDEFHDLYPYFIGCEKCEPSHAFGPTIRDYNIIHYVKSGKGKFKCRGKEYDVKVGEAFVITPGEMTYYVADEKEPWEYYWIAFSGSLSSKFATLECPIIKASAEIFVEPVTQAEKSNISEEFIISKLYLLYGELFSERRVSGQTAVQTVLRYIRHNYMENLSVDSLAASVNFDRRYLARIFKAETGFSVMRYILNVRCEKAKSFLKLGYNVRQTSLLVGYGDAYTFSKMFKRQVGISPSEFRMREIAQSRL